MTDQPEKPQAAGAPEKPDTPPPAASKSEAQAEEPAAAKPADSNPPASSAAPAEDQVTAKPADSSPSATAPAAAPVSNGTPAEVKPAAPPPAADDKKPATDAAPQEPVKSSPFTVPITDESLKLPEEPAATSALPSLADILKPSPLLDTQPPQTAPLPPPPKPGFSGGTICPTCGHRNRPGVLLCENCGTNLTTGKQTVLGTRDLKRDQDTAASDGNRLLDTGQTKALDSAGSSVFTENMVLRFEIEGAATPMLVFPKAEIILGRRDPNTGAMPDVDLTAYAGYRMGVSRRHASIRFQDRQLHVSDLGSSNGTFLNGTRLNAHRPYQLRDGDEVRLGQMVLRLYFQSGRK
ncbi:MAG: FHA domain-containing protein [Chloroflexi bacterium]|nr:FHA domain-containing protein [Chloroflexota bacterium]